MKELDLFFDYIKSNKMNPELTIKNYNIWISEFISIANINDVNDINNIDTKLIINYKNFLLNKGNGLSTIKTKMASIKSFFEYLCDEHILEKNPITKRLIPQAPRKVKNIPTEQELNSIFDAIEKRPKYNILLNLFASTGMRFSELTLLKISDINGNQIKITGKGSKERIILIPNEILEKLIYYIKEQRKFPKILTIEEFNEVRSSVKYKNFNSYKSYLQSREESKDLIFLSITGCKLDDGNLNKVLQKIAEKIGIDVKNKDITVHSFRHFYATYGLDNGIPLDVMQENLGHESINTTRIYATTSIARREKENWKGFNFYRKEDNSGK